MPKWKHDCDRCRFLGTLDGADMYHCDQQGRPTVIARFGDDGPDYVSGVPTARMARADGRVLAPTRHQGRLLRPGEQGPTDPTHRALRVAYLIAQDCGLVAGS